MTALLERPLQRKALQKEEKLAWEEYLALPEGPPYHEYEAGMLIEMVRPHGRHQEIIAALIAVLYPFIMRHKLGRLWPEIAVNLAATTRMYVPDLVFLSADNMHLYAEREGRIYGTPDLVVEILSPSTRSRDRTDKMQAYQQAGVAWYWLVEQDDLTIEEFELTPRGYLANQLIAPGAPFQPTLFPDLTIDLIELMGETVSDLEDTESTESAE